ncbi:MAG: PQQ-binding-like beta-propeller repeat protein [Verrucomicrobia subdivision 3 bacterium]|nr:PQQ-binding-like beta-propeller repeat protein [Limisphaerales bacterium]
MNLKSHSVNRKAGRVTPRAPFGFLGEVCGAHGVTRPTTALVSGSHFAKAFHAWSLCLLLAASTALYGSDWRRFRGPHGNGAADAAPVPAVLDATNSIAWKSNLPGRGLSSPIIVGDRVFVTCSSGLSQQRLHVICFNATDGAKLWERQFWATGRTMCHEKTAVAAPTPASDGEHIVAIFSSNDIVCLDLAGNLIWFRGLGRDYPHASNSLGMTSSLLIAGGVVVAQVESQSEAFTAGLELATGMNRWKITRSRGPNWTSPVLLQTGGAELVALQSARGIVAIEPATGQTVWSYTNKTSATPSSSLNGSTLLVPSQGLTALGFGSGEPVPKQLWRSGQLNPGTPSPAVLRDKVFALNDGGVLTCGNAATGERLWQLRLKGPFSASPVVAGQFLYCVNEKGLAQVVDTTKPEGEVVSELDLGETVLSTPSIAHGAIYFRSDGRLWKFGKS